MTRLAVGSGCPIRASVPTYAWLGMHCLILPLSGITGAELRAVKKGEAEFGIVEDGPISTLLFRFGDVIEWSDATFNILEGGRVQPETITSIIEAFEESGKFALMTTVLVEKRSNIVQAIRTTTVSENMTKQMRVILNNQIEYGPISDSEMRGRTEALYRRFPQSRDMLSIAVARSLGGVGQ